LRKLGHCSTTKNKVQPIRIDATCKVAFNPLFNKALNPIAAQWAAPDELFVTDFYCKVLLFGIT